MSTTPPSARMTLLMRPTDLAAIDKLAVREGLSRASWVRRLLRTHLRALAAEQAVEAA